MKSLIILPTYNEKGNIKDLTAEILSLDKNFNVLIVDDNSPDGTGKEADELAEKFSGRVNVIHKEKKEGLAKAYISGFKWALRRDYDLIFEMDADFSHRPEYLPKFLENINNYDLIVGSRYYKGRISVVNWDLRRVFLSTFANFYAKLVTGVPISDATTGFKCFKRKVLESVDLDKIISEGYSFQIEMNWRAHKAGFKIGEIPIIFYERKHGESKLSASILREGLWILWKMKLKL